MPHLNRKFTRRGGRLGNPQRMTFPKRLLFFDTETKQINEKDGKTTHLFRLATYNFIRLDKDGNEIKRETGIVFNEEDLGKIIVGYSTTKDKLYVFAANIVFDLRVGGVFSYLDAHGYDIKTIHAKGMSIILKYVCGKRVILFLNVQNYYRSSVAQMGEMVGLPKLPHPPWDGPDEEFIPYCKRDTDIITEAILHLMKFYRKLGGTSFGNTMPRLTSNLFRCRFGGDKLVIPCNENETKLSREAYHGGRCQVFKVGKYTGEPLYKLDVNSMYPAQMWRYEYPVALSGYWDKSNLDDLTYKLQYGCVIAEVDISPKSPRYPHKVNNHITYPLYPFRTVLTTRHLKYALDAGEITDVYRLACYRPARIFKEFVEFLYHLKVKYREKSRKAEEQVVKDLLNSLYGWFGRYHTEMIEIPGVYDKHHICLGYRVKGEEDFRDVYQLNGKAFIEAKLGEALTSFPAIAAHITADAQLYLFSLMELAGWENLYYSDTDSLIVNETGYRNLQHLIHPTRLGYLKIEEITDEASFYARKAYRFGNQRKIKGIPKDAVEVSSNTFEYTTFPGFRTIMKSDIKCPYVTYTTSRHIKPQIYDGIVQPDGQVTPFTNPSQIWWTH